MILESEASVLQSFRPFNGSYWHSERASIAHSQSLHASTLAPNRKP